MAHLSRIIVVSLFCFFPALLLSQNQLPKSGFATAEEAADTLWSRMAMKKFQTLKNFVVSDSQFLKEARKTDTITPETFISGQYMNYSSKVDRSGKKTFKSLRKTKIPLKKAVRDTLLLYNATAGFKKSELYFKYKKRSGYIKFNLWLVDDRWYLTGKIDWVENN